MNYSFFIILLVTTLNSVLLSGQEINQYDDQGKQHGKWIKYYEKTEIKRYEGQFEHGVPTGQFTYYYNTGKLQTTANYEKNGTVCHTVSYFGNGNKHAEGTYLNKEKDGKWIFYDGYNNMIATDFYLKGKKHGLCTTYRQSGELIEELNYIEGTPNGIWKRYYSSGNLHIEGGMLNNHWNGEFIFYTMEGKKIVSGKYVKSLKEGDWVYYDEIGKLIKVITYKNGSMKAKKVFQKEKDSDFIELIEAEEIMKKIKTGVHDGDPENPFE